MKDFLPSLKKYIAPDLAEETFSDIYHWTFTYLRENGMRKVIELDVGFFETLTGRPQSQCYKSSLQIGRINISNRSWSFSNNLRHRLNRSTRINGTVSMSFHGRWMLSLQDIQMKRRGPFWLTNMFHGEGNGIGKNSNVEANEDSRLGQHILFVTDGIALVFVCAKVG